MWLTKSYILGWSKYHFQYWFIFWMYVFLNLQYFYATIRTAQHKNRVIMYLLLCKTAKRIIAYLWHINESRIFYCLQILKLFILNLMERNTLNILREMNEFWRSGLILLYLNLSSIVVSWCMSLPCY